MDALSWTGVLAPLNTVLLWVTVLLGIALVVQFIWSFVPQHRANTTYDLGDAPQGFRGLIGNIVWWVFLAVLAILLAYIVIGAFIGTDAGIIGGMSHQLLPVWISMIVIFGVSIATKGMTGLYGRLFDSPIGMIGFALVLFWVLVALLSDMIITHPSWDQYSGMKNKVPGTPLPFAADGEFQWFLLGGDNLARDVFSRVIEGTQVVLRIAPIATAFAFMVGITLGLPAGFYGGRMDGLLSFLANLILSFPVILLFYLLVTKEIQDTGLPNVLAGILFLFPILFLCVLWYSRFKTQARKCALYIGLTILLGGWIYLGTAWGNDPLLLVRKMFGGQPLESYAFAPNGLAYMAPNILLVFVSVVFVNSPTVFRIVRGITLDIKTRDYVAAAQTRGEGAWYIMLWEILPNARGPLIVDFCLRIGYTTILLGTLGFFGLGLSSESADWGSTINAGRRLLTVYAHPPLPPAIALMTFVLGLNLLADGLREQSLKD